MIEQPAASLGALFEPFQERGRVVFPGPPGLGQGSWPDIVQEPAAQLTDLFHLPFIGLELRLEHAVRQPSVLAPLGPVERPRQLRRVNDKLAFRVVARFEVIDPLPDALVELDGVFLRQDPPHGSGMGAILERIELGAGLAGLGLGPRGAL